MPRRLLRRGPSLLFWLALSMAALSFAGEFNTSVDRLSPSAVDSGGKGGIVFDTYRLDAGAGEVGVSSLTFDTYRLYPGLLHRAAFPGTVTGLQSAVLSSETVRLSWSAPGYDGGLGALQPGTSYYIQHATWAAVPWDFASAQVVRSTSGGGPGQSQGWDVSALSPNTTHFFRLWTKDAAGNLSGLSNATTAATLAKPPLTQAQPFLQVGLSSITAGWIALPAAPPSAASEGYRLEASTVADFSGTIASSATPNVRLSTLTVSGLLSSTTYYFRVGALNWLAAANYAAIGSTRTQVSEDLDPPDPVNTLTASTDTAVSARLTWSAPLDISNDPLSGQYAIQHSTWAGVSWSTASAQDLFALSNVSPGTPQERVVSGLDPNTTYFFYLWTSDIKPNWSDISNSTQVATLAKAVANVALASVFASSAHGSWDALPASPSSSTARGYRLEAS
ncbi:MAG: fibronectin type III domain-containing protein, partial [Elusimicrobia bacterium]|nr:fibronectin type III domain-containing protein [Elusimicrobiota bacterium]